MKMFTAFVIFFLVVTPLYAATQTLTTYYPAPNGDYNKLHSTSLQLTQSTLKAIQAQYHCSYDTASGLPPCPAGIIYFDTDAQVVFISTSNHWSSVNATCVPLVACSDTLNCSTDSCGNSCGTTCPGQNICSSTTPGIPGSCA